MIGRDELIRWLMTFPKAESFAIDDGGLQLVALSDPDTYYNEIGGIPLDDDEPFQSFL